MLPLRQTRNCCNYALNFLLSNVAMNDDARAHRRAEHRYKGNNEWVDANLGCWLEYMNGNHEPLERLHAEDAAAGTQAPSENKKGLLSSSDLASATECAIPLSNGIAATCESCNLGPAANEEAAVTPTSPSSLRPSAITTDDDDSSSAETLDEAAGAVERSDASARSPSPDSPAPFSYTAPGVPGHGRAAPGTAATAAGVRKRRNLSVQTGSGSSHAMGTPELSPTSAVLADVSSLAALVAAASPPSSALKRCASYGRPLTKFPALGFLS